MAEGAPRKGQLLTSMARASGGREHLLSSLLCGKRFFKICFLLLVVLLLLSLSLFLWSGVTSSWRPFGVRTRCRSQLNGTSFLTRPAPSCNRSAPFLVLLVMSRLGEFETRVTIRQTWGSERRFGEARAVTYFLLGDGGHRQAWIEREAALQRDIIQGDFQDTYYNLTLKVMMGLEWVCRYCPSAAFVMKTDSDMFVNTDYLLELLSRAPRTNLYTGVIYEGARPFRETTDRWYVSKEEYPEETYPPYCAGGGYVMSADVACRVWDISGAASMFKLEDVYVGLRVAELKVKPAPLHTEPVFFNGRVPFSICSYRRLVTSHQIRNFEKVLYWKSLQDSVGEPCPGEP